MLEQPMIEKLLVVCGCREWRMALRSSARLNGSFSRRDQNALDDRPGSHPTTEVA